MIVVYTWQHVMGLSRDTLAQSWGSDVLVDMIFFILPIVVLIAFYTRISLIFPSNLDLDLSGAMDSYLIASSVSPLVRFRSSFGSA